MKTHISVAWFVSLCVWIGIALLYFPDKAIAESKSQIKVNLGAVSNLVTACLTNLSTHNVSSAVEDAIESEDKADKFDQSVIIAKAAFETLKCCKIATETINNLDERANEIFGLGKQGDGVTPEDIATLVLLATSRGPDSPPGRILPN